MLKSIYVEGYKGLRAVDLGGLSRINIVVGQSSSGKTALLESVRIALAGSPSSMWMTATARGGISFFPPNATGDRFEQAWRQFFSDFDSDELIRFSATNTDEMTSHVTVYFDREKSITLSTPSTAGSPAVFSQLNPLAFERVDFEGNRSRLTSFLSEKNGFQLEEGPNLGYSSEFLSSGAANSFQSADWFSSLSIDDLEHEIVETISQVFPNVTGLSVQSPNGFASLYGTLRDINRKLPLTSISSGLSKFVTVLLAMNVRRGGVILLDEIENGIFYRMFPTLWETIIKFAFSTNTQVFASTHSWECLRALSPLIDFFPEDFSLLQVQHDDGVTDVRVVEGKDARNAIEGDIEVRR